MTGIGNFSTRSGDDICLFIQKHWKELGYAPTIRDIAKAFDMRSSSTALDTIRNLERRGRIVRYGKRKTIQVVTGWSVESCDHDWRVKDPKPKNGEIKVVCVLCRHETAKEFTPDPNEPKTWLRFVG
jgi:hypothetical protein